MFDFRIRMLVAFVVSSFISFPFWHAVSAETGIQNVFGISAFGAFLSLYTSSIFRVMVVIMVIHFVGLMGSIALRFISGPNYLLQRAWIMVLILAMLLPIGVRFMDGLILGEKYRAKLEKANPYAIMALIVYAVFLTFQKIHSQADSASSYLIAASMLVVAPVPYLLRQQFNSFADVIVAKIVPSKKSLLSIFSERVRQFISQNKVVGLYIGIYFLIISWFGAAYSFYWSQCLEPCFYIPNEMTTPSFFDFLYFSLGMSLTGDTGGISPKTQPAKLLGGIEMIICSVWFLVILQAIVRTKR